MQTLRKTISLKNLATSCIKGQIATLLIFLMVVVLMFILVTINIGEVANLSTMLSNAADTATLQLASQLATKSRQISKALEEACGDDEECCAKTGLLHIILAIIAAIIVTIATGGTGAPLGISWVLWVIGSAAIAGAIGGAIVYETWEGAAYGALEGALIGAAIAGGYAAAAKIAAKGAALKAGTVAYQGALKGGLSMAEATNIARLAFTQVMTAYGGAAMTLEAGSALYIGDPIQQRNANSLKKIGDALNGLPERDRIRQQAILTSLSMTVTDSEMTDPEILGYHCSNGVDVDFGDPEDIDGDGNRRESMSCFEYWYYYKVSKIKEDIIDEYKEAIERFFSDYLVGGLGYLGYIKSLYANGGLLSRQEIEGTDGLLIQVLRAMEGSYPPPAAYDFWSPGPSADNLTRWQSCNSKTCPQPECAVICPSCSTDCPNSCGSCVLSGYDEVDWNIDAFKDFVALADSLIARSPETLALSWRDWIGQFIGYDSDCPVCGFENQEGVANCTACGAPLNSSGYYNTLLDMVYGNPDGGGFTQGIKGYWTWIDYFYDDDGPSGPDWGVKEQLPDCTYDPVTGAATNYPCGLALYPGCASLCEFKATIDADPLTEELLSAYGQIYNLYFFTAGSPDLNFMRGLEILYSSLMNAQPDPSIGDTSEYKWTDAQGEHSIKVDVSFKIPKTKEDKRGNFLVGEECIVLKYGDDDCNGSRRTWVRITRTDPSKEIKSGKRALGWWNPAFRSNLGKTITRISRASYNKDGAAICGRDE